MIRKLFGFGAMALRFVALVLIGVAGLGMMLEAQRARVPALPEAASARVLEGCGNQYRVLPNPQPVPIVRDTPETMKVSSQGKGNCEMVPEKEFVPVQCADDRRCADGIHSLENGCKFADTFEIAVRNGYLEFDDIGEAGLNFRNMAWWRENYRARNGRGGPSEMQLAIHRRFGHYCLPYCEMYGWPQEEPADKNVAESKVVSASATDITPGSLAQHPDQEEWLGRSKSFWGFMGFCGLMILYVISVAAYWWPGLPKETVFSAWWKTVTSEKEVSE